MASKGGDTSSALGLLILRASTAALLIYGHGWPKLMHFAEKSRHFSDPLHIGPANSLALTIFAEVGCAAAVLLGFATRFAVIALLIQFGVIIFIVHGGAPLDDRELAILYAIPFTAIALLGPGRYSIDGARGNA